MRNSFIKNLLKNRFFRFLLVGGLNTIFGYSVFAFFIFLKIHFTLASLMSTVMGIIFNFKTTGKLVFKSSDNKLILKFVGVYTIIYLLNISILKIFKLLGIDMYIAGALVLLPMAIVSYFLNKKFVFKG